MGKLPKQTHPTIPGNSVVSPSNYGPAPLPNIFDFSALIK